MQNYVSDGAQIPLTAPGGGVVSGTPYLINNTLVVAMETVAAGLVFPALFEGNVAFPKVAGTAMPEGTLVYWDNAAKNVTTTAGGNTKLGVVTTLGGAAAGATLVNVRYYASY